MIALLLLLFVTHISALCPTACKCRNSVVRCKLIPAETVRQLPTGTTELIILRSELPLLSQHYFSHLPLLSSLTLADCGISQLDPRAFSNLQQLSALSLADNELSDLPEEVLDSLPALQYLDLSKNKLRRPPSLQNLPKLRTLKLSENLLAVLPDLKRSSLLQELDMRGNRLVTVASPLPPLRYLRTLNLGDNKLKELPQDLFSRSDFASLNQLQLNQNQLTHLHGNTFETLNSITLLDLTDNDFICDCQLSSLRNWMETRFGRTDFSIDQRTPLCAAPAERKDRAIMAIHTSEFVCTTTTTTTSTTTTTTQRPSTALPLIESLISTEQGLFDDKTLILIVCAAGGGLLSLVIVVAVAFCVCRVTDKKSDNSSETGKSDSGSSPSYNKLLISGGHLGFNQPTATGSLESTHSELPPGYQDFFNCASPATFPESSVFSIRTANRTESLV